MRSREHIKSAALTTRLSWDRHCYGQTTVMAGGRDLVALAEDPPVRHHLRKRPLYLDVMGVAKN